MIATGVGIIPWVATAQSTKPAQQGVYLPDPTPRQPDLERQYSDDPVQRAKQQQALILRNEQRRALVVLATDKLFFLAQELKADVAKNDKESSVVPNKMKAEQIEKLAKIVKDSVKSQ